MKEKLKEVENLRTQIGAFTKRLLDADQSNLTLKTNLVKVQEMYTEMKKAKAEVHSLCHMPYAIYHTHLHLIYPPLIFILLYIHTYIGGERYSAYAVRAEPHQGSAHSREAVQVRSQVPQFPIPQFPNFPVLQVPSSPLLSV
jgi:hypothetical protein